MMNGLQMRDMQANLLKYPFIYVYVCVCFFSLSFHLLQVSWVRRRDYHLLTVSLTTYSSDERYSVSHAKHSEVSTKSPI